MNERGLDRDGTIAREGALDRVPPLFGPVVDAARSHIAETFESPRLHSAYLYGSIPRGTATPGVSDLDLQLALHDEPIEADRADAKAIEAALDHAFPQINGVGILLTSTCALLSDANRYDGGFFIACLCTPLLGRLDQRPRQVGRTLRPVLPKARWTDVYRRVHRPRPLGRSGSAGNAHRRPRHLAGRRIHSRARRERGMTGIDERSRHGRTRQGFGVRLLWV